MQIKRKTCFIKKADRSHVVSPQEKLTLVSKYRNEIYQLYDEVTNGVFYKKTLQNKLLSELTLINRELVYANLKLIYT